MLHLDQLLESIKSNTILPIDSIEFVNVPIKCRIGFIGDIHGDLSSYLLLSSKAKNTIQLGDMYNSTGVSKFFLNRNSIHHKYITGNHDWLESDFIQPPNNLGDYGIINFDNISIKIGYIRGANSIDKNRRLHAGFDKYHYNEELSYSELCDAIDYINDNKPDVMVTHMAPLCVHSNLRLLSQYGLVKSRTMYALESLFEGHQPKLWCYGHYHQNMIYTINGTVFVCVNMNEMMPII